MKYVSWLDSSRYAEDIMTEPFGLKDWLGDNAGVGKWYFISYAAIFNEWYLLRVTTLEITILEFESHTRVSRTSSTRFAVEEKFFLRVAQRKKAKDFFVPNSYIQGYVRGSRWVRQGRREGGSREGKVPCALHQEFLFLVHEYSGSERPISLEYRLLRDLVYEEAMCEGSSGNGLPYAARAVP